LPADDINYTNTKKESNVELSELHVASGSFVFFSLLPVSRRCVRRLLITLGVMTVPHSTLKSSNSAHQSQQTPIDNDG
jgi:hypothetical protein